MPDTGYFHLHLVSDSTGETLITVARAAAAQYANVSPVEHLYPMVRSKKQLDHVLTEITDNPGLVLYTLLEEDLIELLEAKCRELGLPCMSVLGPILRLFQSYLGAETIHRAMQGSQFSIVNDPAWRPTLGPNNTTFRMSDLLLFAFEGKKDLLAPLG